MLQSTLCYLERGDAYLMLHRVKKEHDANRDKWIGIGGKFEDKESPEDCLLRECREETGLTLTDYRYRGLVTFVNTEWPTEYMHLFTATGWTGGEAVPVAKESCGLTLEALAQGKTGRESGVPIGGKMLVFCGLERELDGLLAALRQAGVVCLKAVLTPDNRSWTPGRLYRELQREHRAMGRG